MISLRVVDRHLDAMSNFWFVERHGLTDTQLCSCFQTVVVEMEKQDLKCKDSNGKQAKARCVLEGSARMFYFPLQGLGEDLKDYKETCNYIENQVLVMVQSDNLKVTGKVCCKKIIKDRLITLLKVYKAKVTGKHVTMRPGMAFLEPLFRIPAYYVDDNGDKTVDKTKRNEEWSPEEIAAFKLVIEYGHLTLQGMPAALFHFMHLMSNTYKIDLSADIKEQLTKALAEYKAQQKAKEQNQEGAASSSSAGPELFEVGSTVPSQMVADEVFGEQSDWIQAGQPEMPSYVAENDGD